MYSHQLAIPKKKQKKKNTYTKQTRKIMPESPHLIVLCEQDYIVVFVTRERFSFDNISAVCLNY